MKYLTLFGLLLCLFAVLEFASSVEIKIKTRTHPVIKLKKPLTKKEIKNMRPKSYGKPMGKKMPHPLSGKVASKRPAIIGGTAVTDIKQFPWMVFMLVNNAWYCGGSVISEDYVMTAGHCIYQATVAELYMGTVTWRIASSRVVFGAATFILHPGYNDVTIADDIGLIKLNKTIDKVLYIDTGIIRPIALPPLSKEFATFVGELATVSGFGLTKTFGTVSDVLNVVSMQVITNAACARIYRGFITDKILCTSQTTDGKNTNICSGDSGSALHVAFTNVTTGSVIRIEIGIVSFGAARSCTRFPSGYTRVTSYLSFISNITGIAILP